VEGRRHLLIPDAHACPGEDLRRFDWLGELILLLQPDVIVDIGDWFDMPSLCSYDKGTRSFEGRRYNDDIEAGHEADMRAFGPIVKYNGTRSCQKKKQYNPEIYRIRGNHEQRILKCAEKEPMLEGTIGMEDITPRLTSLDFRVSPFLKPVIVDGVCYSHYFVSGIMGKPVSSARMMLAKHHISCTAGHAHLRDWAEGIRADGSRIQGLICGSFHDPDHRSSYAPEQAQALWWDGLHIKDHVKNGDYDRTEISVRSLQRMMEGS
jgi:hypothetical protein